eukprot:g8784.t1
MLDELQVTEEEGRAKAEQMGAFFIATSAKTAANVDMAFLTAAQNLVEMRRRQKQPAAKAAPGQSGPIGLGNPGPAGGGAPKKAFFGPLGESGRWASTAEPRAMTTFLSFNESFNSKLTFTAEDRVKKKSLRFRLSTSNMPSMSNRDDGAVDTTGRRRGGRNAEEGFAIELQVERLGTDHAPGGQGPICRCNAEGRQLRYGARLLEALEPHPATQRVAGAEALGRGSLVREPSVRAGQSFEAVIQVREQPDGLRVIDALMIFRENIRPEWEDKMNANGGHFQFQLKPNCGGGQIDEYWNNLAIGTLRKNVEKCMAHKLDGAHGTGAKVEYWQNCAARGLCDTLFHLRTDAAVHQAPAGAPKGHWKPLGHPDFLETWDGEVDRFDVAPTPELFWTKYHAERRPFIVKGAVLDSPAINWTDQYIMEHFGDEAPPFCGHDHDPLPRVSLHDRRSPRVFPRGIRNFIRQSSKDPNWAKYIISQMPDAMGKDWKVPGFFNCGKRFEGDKMRGKPWMTQMYENNFWYLRVPPQKMGTSTIHYDMNHQVMCMFAGKKEWIMWDLRHEASKIPMWNEYFRPNGRPQGSDDSPIDGERGLGPIDRGGPHASRATSFPMRSDDADDPRIIALMTMFQSEVRYEPSNCIDAPEKVFLSEYDVLWGEFPGSLEVPRCMNHVKMGYPNWKRTLASMAKKEVSVKSFTKFWGREGYPSKLIKAAWKRFQQEQQGFPATMTWAEKVFNSTALANLAKDVACAGEGHDQPERKLRDGESWDARNEYSLAGEYKGYTDEKHQDLPSFYVPRATPRATLKLCCALSLVLRTAHGVRFQSDASRVPSEVEDPCAGEANETKRMVLALGVWNAGWEGNHCRWPGVVCAPKSCHVRHLKFTGCWAEPTDRPTERQS